MALEERFTQPPGWRIGEFFNAATGHKIHYGTVTPESPRAVAVILPGLSEFTEKYYEMARDLLKRNIAVWVIDWAYQGRSTRHAKYPMRRHSDGFEADISDLHKLVGDFALPGAQGRPLVLIGHSMGGHLALRYLATHPGIFKAADLSAPMLGINDLKHISPAALSALLRALKPFGALYVPRGRDWHETMRKNDGTDIFSSDPVRDRIHTHWCLADPALRVGNPTIRWVYEAVASCRWLEPRLSGIDVPLMIGYGGREAIIDNDAIVHAGALLPRAELLELPDANHEILMERDESRGRWLAAFDKLLQTADIL